MANGGECVENSVEMRSEMKDNTRFLNGLAQFHVKLEEKQLCQFDQYYELLIQWNRVMNLTAITEYEEVVTKHFLDSLSIVKAYPDWLELYNKDHQEIEKCKRDIQISKEAKKDIEIGESMQYSSTSEESKKDVEIGESKQHSSTSEESKKNVEIGESKQHSSTSEESKKNVEIGESKQHSSTSEESKKNVEIGESKQHSSTSEESKKNVEIGDSMQYSSTSGESKKDIEISEKYIRNTLISKEYKNNISVLENNKIYKHNSKKLLDLGTGAGFPGIPLKIAFPELEITLVDSLNKRVNFLNEVIKQLGLSGICAVHGRAEELGQKENYREQYDYCVSRAVAKLHLLAEYCIPFVKQGGYFISYKSGKVEEEIGEANYAIQKLGGTYKNTISFLLPDSDIERSLIVIGKRKKTEKQYPRNAGRIAKKPLII